jgi:mono/diheme cytochrome c family protein
MRSLRRRMRACGQLALCVALSACAFRAAATESELSLTVAGRTMTYAPASLLGMPAATTISIPNDAVYKRAMSFRAVPAAALLSGASGDESIRFAAADGRGLVLPAALVLARAGAATAYLAVETDDAPWPLLRATQHATAGPFYLVWTYPERSGITPELWTAQVTHIEILPSLARRFPMLAPASAASAKSPVRRGFLVYVRQCSVCHTLNGGGDSSIGPDLNIPYNPTEYLRVDALRRLIRDPQSLHRWTEARMPAYSKSALSDRELTDLVDYLRYMADRKIVAGGAK